MVAAMVVAAMAAETMVAAMVVAAMAAEIMVAAMVAAAMAAEILRLTHLIQINLLVLKVGRIEVMEVLLKTLNTKVEEAEEKEGYQMSVIYQMKRINNPYL